MYASSVESSQPEIAAHVYGLKTCQDDTFCSSHGHSMDAYLASRSSQTSKFATVMGAINDTLAPITANADPNGIQDAANRGVNNINSVTAHNQEVRAREYKPAVTITPSTGQSVAHSATATSSVGTGNAPPPNCVYLSPSQPCVPLAQYAQMQAQQQASGQGICPASGFVPGVMLRVESDVGK